MPILISKEMQKFTKEKIYPVSIFDSDKNNSIKPSLLLNYMQSLAAESIDCFSSSVSCNGLAQNGLGWFLIRYRIEFDDYPENVEKIRILTESRGCHRMTAFRDFEAYDAISGNRLLRATSSWFIVDLNNKSILNIQHEYPDVNDFEKREDDLILQKLKPIDRVDNEKVFHVRYDDLDLNGHVNNTVYITWALEALDYEFRSTHKLKTLDIYYKHEVKYGEDILSSVKIDNENSITEHLIKNVNTGNEVCLLRAKFIKI